MKDIKTMVLLLLLYNDCEDFHHRISVVLFTKSGSQGTHTWRLQMSGGVCLILTVWLLFSYISQICFLYKTLRGRYKLIKKYYFVFDLVSHHNTNSVCLLTLIMLFCCLSAENTPVLPNNIYSLHLECAIS